MSEKWNRFIYRMWAPIYDTFFNTGYFLRARKKVFQDTAFSPQQKILFVGVGTGVDLELIDLDGLDIVAIDYSPDMLDQARKKFRHTTVRFIEMDAQEMDFENSQFDVVIGSLILSVVPHAEKGFQEMERVLKPGGKLIVFVKFLHSEKELSLPKKLIRPIIKLLGTDIGLSFEKLYDNSGSSLLLKEDISIMFKGMYRKIVLVK